MPRVIDHVHVHVFVTAGQDDKYWAGHFGTMMCGATVRVTRERTANPDDDYVDISYADDVTSLRQHAAVRNTLLSRVLGDHAHLLKQTQVAVTDLEQDVDAFARHDVTRQVRWGKKKRREIRVFVSSTFRDFREE